MGQKRPYLANGFSKCFLTLSAISPPLSCHRSIPSSSSGNFIPGRLCSRTNRALAVGQIASPEEAEQILQARMADISPSATVSAEIVDNIAEASVAMPIGDISMFHTFDAFTGFDVTASSQQLIEN